MRPAPDDARLLLVEELTAAVNARDFERLIELTDPEVEFRSLVADVEGGVFRGLEGMRKWAENVDSVLEDFRIELLEVHDAGPDRLVVLYRITGTGKTSGFPVETRVGQVWTWVGGRALRNDVYNDPDDAFRAAGLEPPPG